MTIKGRVLSIILITVTALLLVYLSTPSNKIWGAGEEPYMVIAGKKPSDAKISVQVQYFGRGESCSGWSWNAGSGKLNTGNYNESFNFEHNFSTDETEYELRVPFQERQPEVDCFTQLSDMELKLTNAFDTVSFATLRIYQAGTDNYNKPVSTNSKIAARDCNGHLYQRSKDVWKGTIGCQYYVDDIKLSQTSQTNAETIYFDFSKFNADTVIHYDILAGDDYRSEPLDPQTGK